MKPQTLLQVWLVWLVSLSVIVSETNALTEAECLACGEALQDTQWAIQNENHLAQGCAGHSCTGLRFSCLVGKDILNDNVVVRQDTEIMCKRWNGVNLEFMEVTDFPTASPTTPLPTASPTIKPSSAPTETPTLKPSVAPTTTEPTAFPTEGPTGTPTRFPTVTPSTSPTTSQPSAAPSTSLPTPAPSKGPTGTPTTYPTLSPSTSPITSQPSAAPTTSLPTPAPSKGPTRSPVVGPTLSPTLKPTTISPTVSPTLKPTDSPVTFAPTTLLESQEKVAEAGSTPMIIGISTASSLLLLFLVLLVFIKRSRKKRDDGLQVRASGVHYSFENPPAYWKPPPGLPPPRQTPPPGIPLSGSTLAVEPPPGIVPSRQFGSDVSSSVSTGPPAVFGAFRNNSRPNIPSVSAESLNQSFYSSVQGSSSMERNRSVLGHATHPPTPPGESFELNLDPYDDDDDDDASF